jgi:hypothetical protein
MKGQGRRDYPLPPPLEPRLQRRYQKLVQEHLQISQSVAAGLSSLPGVASSFASTQAAWRFYRNEHVSLPALAQPLIEQGRRALQGSGAEYGLVIHDWSHLNYDRHTRKADRIDSAKDRRQGYELQSALLLSDRQGEPLAPIYQNLRCSAGLHSTRCEPTVPTVTHLDELGARFEHLEQLALGRPLVHLVDREGDSVGHFRQWERHRFLVRAKGGQRVEWDGRTCLLSAVADQMKRQLVYCRPVEWHGRSAKQYVGETSVVLTRRTRQKRRGAKPVSVAGKPVRLRLIVSEVRAEHGRVLAQWLLLTNVSAEVEAARLALWYYWRWRIESFFKLLKSAGQQIEHWQQESGLQVARRLLVVSGALVLVWQLARAQGTAAGQLRTILVRLSGRQMRWGREWTTPALLAGVWGLLAMLELLEHYDLSQLRQLARTFFNPDEQR